MKISIIPWLRLIIPLLAISAICCQGLLDYFKKGTTPTAMFLFLNPITMSVLTRILYLYLVVNLHVGDQIPNKYLAFISLS